VIRDYLVSAHPQQFSVSIKRNTSGPVTEHSSEKALYTTAENFPTILRRSEIVAAEEIRLSAKETALERIVRKTAEMTAVEKRLFTDGDTSNEVAQLLVDAISISVNLDSENSVVNYRELLPSPPQPAVDEDGDVLEELEPMELNAQENAIKIALVDHAIMIRRCLAAFAKSSNPILTGSYEDLHKCKRRLAVKLLDRAAANLPFRL